MKNFMLVAGLLVAAALQAQKMPDDYFEEGLAFSEKKEYTSAASSFRYIVEHYPKSEVYPMAFYNLGYVYYLNNQPDSALPVFRAILYSDFNEKQELGGDIMSNPYANYRHQASQLMSTIYYDRNQLDSCLHYFALSDTVYPFIHFCGNAYAEQAIGTALRYADIYEKMGKPQEAIKALLPQVFDSGLADNKEVLVRLERLLKTQKIKKPKQQLDDALTKMYPKTFHRDSTSSYTYHYFTFLGAEIQVPGSYESGKRKFDRDESMDRIKKSEFYKMIAGL